MLFSSTRNTRIERMWGEVGAHFARKWWAFFTQLEMQHHLNPEKPEHLWLLHLLFLDDINNDCITFQQEWNAHPISGLGHNRSPLVSFILFLSLLYIDRPIGII